MLHIGHALDLLPTLEPGSARTCITSPPYWGLRDYGDPGQEWPAVDFTLSFGGADVPVSVPAMRAQLGQEETPIAYVAHLVAIFRAVRDALADDGTLWLNLGDTYASNTKGSGGASSKQASNPGSYFDMHNVEHGMKSKDLCGIPWIVAFALRADGWYLRSDIIWHKRNPMPESVRDRPTKGHEYLFLLAKSEHYHFGGRAIAEIATKGDASAGARNNRGTCGRVNAGQRIDCGRSTRNRRTVWSIASQPYDGAHFAVMPPKLVEPCVLAGSVTGDVVLDPFTGSGTVGAVAVQHGRRFVGIELSPQYAELARERIGKASERAGLISADTAQPGQQLGIFGALPSSTTPLD